MELDKTNCVTVIPVETNLADWFSLFTLVMPSYEAFIVIPPAHQSCWWSFLIAQSLTMSSYSWQSERQNIINRMHT